MGCPFELPVKKEILPRNTKGIALYRLDKVIFPYTEDEADYIIQAINSHEKLVEALKEAEVALLNWNPEDPCFPEIKRDFSELMKDIEQALEAEKK